MTTQEIIDKLYQLRSIEQQKVLMRFFKTGPGEYGEGDKFLGIKVPQTRQIAKLATDLPLQELPNLLTNPWHEVRQCGFFIMSYNMEALCKARTVNLPSSIEQRDALVRLYLQYADYANNWDLVDLSAPTIIGNWLLLPSELNNKLEIMDQLSSSKVLWRQRIAMVACQTPTKQGNPAFALRYATQLLYHPHDLMHKAVGWMLRDVGEHCNPALLKDFLEQHAATMPRTTLRYAIEHYPEPIRRHYMTLKTT